MHTAFTDFQCMQHSKHNAPAFVEILTIKSLEIYLTIFTLFALIFAPAAPACFFVPQSNSRPFSSLISCTLDERHTDLNPRTLSVNTGNLYAVFITKSQFDPLVHINDPYMCPVEILKIIHIIKNAL